MSRTTANRFCLTRLSRAAFAGATLLAACGSIEDATRGGTGGRTVNGGGPSDAAEQAGTRNAAGAVAIGHAGAGGANPSGGTSAADAPSAPSGAGGQPNASAAGGKAGTSSALSGAGGVRGGRGGRGGLSGGAANASGKSGTGGAGGSSGTGTTNSGGSAGAGDSSVPAGYTLVWHDEFDVDGPPNPKNWKFETGFVRNEEAQWYQTANASVADGLLVIEARKERVQNPNYTGSGDWKTSRQYAEYTSSSLETSGLQSWQYGRFELRARVPTVSGMWPAWWTLGVSGEWPSNGEIDIMEYYGGNVHANVACGTSTRWQAKWDSATKALSSLGANWSSDFHVWRMDWDDQTITLSLDDQTLNTTALSSMLNPDGSSPFKQKAYMLVNLALGGSNGGSLDATTFPQRYEIDYVRVFQKN